MAFTSFAWLSCSSVHGISELRNPSLEMDIAFFLGGTRVFDLSIFHDGIPSESCPRTPDSTRGSINGVELDCAPEMPLDARLYGLFACAQPRCYLREGVIPGDTRRVPGAIPTVIAMGDSSIQFEMDTGDILRPQDAVIIPQGPIRAGDPVQISWRGPVSRVLGGTIAFVDQDQNVRTISASVSTSNASLSFAFPATSPGPGTLQLINMVLGAQVDACPLSLICKIAMTYEARLEFPIEVIP